jgi:hypothetical protein
MVLVDSQWVLTAAVNINTNNILVGAGYYYLLENLDPLGVEVLISLADAQLVRQNWWITSLSSMVLFLLFWWTWFDGFWLSFAFLDLFLDFLVMAYSLLSRLSILSAFVNHQTEFSASFPYSEKEDKVSKRCKAKCILNLFNPIACYEAWLSKGGFLPHKSNSLGIPFKIWRYLGTVDQLLDV